jgi:hypothetical protein
MESVNEGTTSILILTFKDENGDPVIPLSGTYRIDDLDSGTGITGDTGFTPSLSTYNLVIGATANRILSGAAEKELRRVTVTFQYGASGQGTGEYFYEVKNLGGLVR